MNGSQQFPPTAITTGHTSHWVKESPDEVVEKRNQALDAEDGTVGDLIALTAVQVRTTEEGMDLSDYRIWVEANDLTEIREVTEGFWLDSTRPPEHPFAQLFGGVQQARQAAAEEHRADDGAADSVIPAIVSETSPEAPCCCEHEAGDHDTTLRFVGACEVDGCGCRQFHTHREVPTSGEAPV